jgi:DNA repair protein RadC
VRERPGLFGDESVNAGGAKAPAKPDHEGHRARLKRRFAEGGADALPDYELLELLLFNAQPRRDMKPLAKRLIAAFGDFNRVVSAPPARLREVEGCGEAAIHQLKLAEAAAHRLARARALGKPALSSWSAVMDYCKTVMAHREVEQFHLLFLDRKNVLIADEAQTRGTVDAAPVYPREVVKRALELNASALILAHNHPSGDPTPSEADIAMTRRLNEALKTVGVTLHDHLVIGKERDASFRALGLL